MRVSKFSIIVLLSAVLLTAGASTLFAQSAANDSFIAPVKIDTIILREPQIFADVDKLGSVHFCGVGFTASESVDIYVQMYSASQGHDVLLGRWVVFADENGMFYSDWKMGTLAGTFEVIAAGEKSAKRVGTTFQSPDIILTHSAHLDQCRNGTLDVPVVCADAAWVGGNAGSSNAHYLEGEAMPYRLLLGNLPIGTNTVTIGYDTIFQSHHAFDYLTTYDFSEASADPCSGVTGCDNTAGTEYLIPDDPSVHYGPDGIHQTGDDIVVPDQFFTLFGGTITGVSGYTASSPNPDSVRTYVTITFNAAVSDPVLAWGAHISTRMNWGIGNSAVAINGSPFATYLEDVNGEGGGSQSANLDSGAVIFPAQITIIKNSVPDTFLDAAFTATGQVTANFILDDDGGADNTYSNTQQFGTLVNFGTGNEVVITETTTHPAWPLTSIACTSNPAGGAGTNNNTISLPDQQVSIVLEEGEAVTCTFTNNLITAAAADISGKVTTAMGYPVRGAIVKVTRMSTGQETYFVTGSFGYYQFTGLPTGEGYVISVNAKRYVFDPAARAVNLNDDVVGLDFIASP